MPNATTEATNTGLRPILSASQPPQLAPITNAKLEAKNTQPIWSGPKPNSGARRGAATPIAWMSKPSSTATAKHSAMLMLLDALRAAPCCAMSAINPPRPLGGSWLICLTYNIVGRDKAWTWITRSAALPWRGRGVSPGAASEYEPGAVQGGGYMKTLTGGVMAALKIGKGVRLWLAVLLVGAFAAHEAVAQEALLGAPFQDHAVVQRDRPIAVWGAAQPGERVSVSMNGRTVRARADRTGAWRANLPALAAGGPHVIEARAGDAVQRISDVLVGDVFLCSGQS